MNFDREHDQRVRTAAFGWLASQVSGEDGVKKRSGFKASSYPLAIEFMTTDTLGVRA